LEELECAENLLFFIKNKIGKNDFDSTVLDRFSRLDDIDVLAAVKKWQSHDDFVLSQLCQMIVNRRLLTIKLKNKPIAPDKLNGHLKVLQEQLQLSKGEASYFVFSGKIQNRAYNHQKQNINILMKNGKLKDVAKASDQLNLKALSKTVTKYYICYPKDSVKFH